MRTSLCCRDLCCCGRVQSFRRTQNCLLALVAVSLLSLLASACLAQYPAETQVASSSPVAQSQSLQPTPRFQPTPEQVADALMLHQRYQAAIAAYRQVLPATAEAWNKMGIAYQMMFNASDATRCYQASLKLDPDNSHVLNNLGTIYDSLKEFSTAERMYRRALKVEPHSALIYKNLGTNLLSQHKYKKGWEAYQSALTIDAQIFERNLGPRIENPATVENRGAMNYYMARGCVRAGKIERAIEYLRAALNEGFTNPRKIGADSEFANLHGVPAFEQLLAEQHNP